MSVLLCERVHIQTVQVQQQTTQSPIAQSCMSMEMNTVDLCEVMCISPCHIRWAGTGSRVLCERLGSPA